MFVLAGNKLILAIERRFLCRTQVRSIDVLKRQQDRLAREHETVEQTLKDNALIVVNVESNLDKCLELIKNWHRSYSLSKPHGRRLMNQVMSEKITVEEGDVTPVMNEAFGLLFATDILKPIEKPVEYHSKRKRKSALLFLYMLTTNPSGKMEFRPGLLTKAGGQR